jgi:hypothetical protein
MPILTDPNEARARLESLLAISTEPVLSSPEVSQLLDDNKRASVWAASTAYAYGDVIIPLARNGRRYVVTTAGTSSTAEPTWSWSVSDGSVLTWQDDGIEYDLWDIRNAAYQGWMLKYAKATCMADVRNGDQAKSKSQIAKHCLIMADRYMPVMVA